jgi:hypothetical protein
MAFLRWIRRNSLFETNHRLRLTVLNTPLLATFLRNRLSNCSCDSLGRSLTVGTYHHLLPHEQGASWNLLHELEIEPFMLRIKVDDLHLNLVTGIR